MKNATSSSTIQDLYNAHRGKVSDKWSSYFNEYQRLFQEFRDEPISLLEIGIQNGGSLEIWAKYFANARCIIGCDINENCRKLTFDDPRVAVFVGDANSDAIKREIARQSARFDIIIDDGSHKSRDIVKSFSQYFPLLNAGGIFFAEDLHCSYWQDFEGGLFDPLSSIAFFKDLSDIINHEHWGIPETRKALLESFRIAYGAEFFEPDLAEIQSVEFMNSICVVRKRKDQDVGLGIRCIAGTLSEVFSPQNQHGSKNLAADESENLWSRSALFNTRSHTAHAAMEMSNLKAAIESLRVSMETTCGQLADTKHELDQANRQIEKLKHILQLREKSISWRITSPLRAIWDTLSRK